MKIYYVQLVKHRFADYDTTFVFSQAVPAEGPCQAVEQWAVEFHTDRNHTCENNTVRVLCPNGERLMFHYRFDIEPVVTVKWDRS